MKHHWNKLLLASIIYLGSIQTQAQEADDFVGDWSLVKVVAHRGRWQNDDVSELISDKKKIIVRVRENMDVIFLINSLIFDEGYLNVNGHSMGNFRKVFYKGKFILKNDTLAIKTFPGPLMCGASPFTTSFKKIEEEEPQ